jgi:hypothetical protein
MNMNRRQIQKKYKRKWQKFFSERLEQVGVICKPSRIKLMNEAQNDRLIMTGYCHGRGIELSLICKEGKDE